MLNPSASTYLIYLSGYYNVYELNPFDDSAVFAVEVCLITILISQLLS